MDDPDDARTSIMDSNINNGDQRTSIMDSNINNGDHSSESAREGGGHNDAANNKNKKMKHNRKKQRAQSTHARGTKNATGGNSCPSD